MLAMVLAIAFGAHIPMPEAAMAASYEATANLNIRSAPDPTSPVIGGIPSGGKVEVTGELQNNFYPITYNGISGFSSADYLSLPGGGSDGGADDGEGGGTTSGPTGTRYADARLNLRSGPATSYGIIATMPVGAAVELTGEVANGFSRLTWNGNNGWAATEYLSTESGAAEPTPASEEPTATPVTPAAPDPESPSIGDTPIGTATVSTVGLSLNLRSGPGTSFGVVRSLPSGAQVEVMGEAQNGFRPVRYQGTSGWASSDFLRVGSAGTPVTPTVTVTATTPPTEQPGGGTIGDTVTGSASVTTVGLSLNMRSGPGTSFGVIRSIPSGAQVEVMGAAQSGFLPVRYQGTKGWAAADYLQVGSGGIPVTPTATATPVTLTTTPTATATATPEGNATGAGTVTAGRLNFRSGPDMTSPVIGVLTFGTRVEITGSAQNGFLPIQAQGTSGWASAEFISVGSAVTPTATATATPITPTATPGTPTPTATPATATPSPSPTIPPGGVSGTAVVSVTGTLNMRSGPGTEFPVIRGLANGSQVDLLGAAQNGFRPIRYQGTDGWASEAYLEIGATNPGDPTVPEIGNAATGKATMNATVSLRSGPATSFGHIQTLNSGWKVEIMGDPVNGWTPIRYNAAKGWVPSGNLTPGWGYQIVDQMITPSRSIPMYTTPGGPTLVVQVPPGTLVDITGPAQGTWVPARWAGYAGWMDASRMYQPEDFVEPGPTSARDAEMISIIYQAADKWGQSRADMLRVARCESFLDPNIVNPASGTSGLFQFRPSTFAFTPNGKRGEDIFDPWSNADAAGWMWANGMRHHWACQ